MNITNKIMILNGELNNKCYIHRVRCILSYQQDYKEGGNIMTDEIIKLLDELAKRFGIAIDWTSENVIPYLEDLFNRFITYNIIISVFWTILLFAVIWFDVWFVKKSLQMYKEDEDNIFFKTFYLGRDITSLWVFTVIAIAVGSLISTILGFIALIEIPKLIFVPEMFMIDWLNVNIG